MRGVYKIPSPPPSPGGRGGVGVHFVRHSKSLAPGFTLIEVLVVVLVLSIVIGMVGVRLTRDESDALRDEAQRLALVLQNAQQQAILEGRPYAFELTPEGYQFLQIVYRDGKFVRVRIEHDELLAPRQLPRLMTLSHRQERKEANRNPDRKDDPLVFDPSGEFPTFTMVLSTGDIVWYVQGSSDGQIRSTSYLEPAAA